MIVEEKQRVMSEGNVGHPYFFISYVDVRLSLQLERKLKI